MKVEALHIAGISILPKALALPYNRSVRGEGSNLCVAPENREAPFIFQETQVLDREDIQLIENLIKAGDEHAKALRGMIVYLQITAPRYWWQEMNTYSVGVTPLGSTSTMHTECKRLSGKELQDAKAAISEGTENTRILMISYQALRRIYKQRKSHRLPEWRVFCESLKHLPLSNLITEL